VLTSRLFKLESMTISDVHPLSGNVQNCMVSLWSWVRRKMLGSSDGSVFVRLTVCNFGEDALASAMICGRCPNGSLRRSTEISSRLAAVLRNTGTKEMWTGCLIVSVRLGGGISSSTRLQCLHTRCTFLALHVWRWYDVIRRMATCLSHG
jgi:hypothetical protein